jgi:hypothetical protein
MGEVIDANGSKPRTPRSRRAVAELVICWHFPTIWTGVYFINHDRGEQRDQCPLWSAFGLKSDISRGPSCARERTRLRGSALRARAEPVAPMECDQVSGVR